MVSIVSLDDSVTVSLEWQMVHLHGDESWLVSQVVERDGTLLPEQSLYKVPVERQVLYVEEEFRELSGTVYEETEEEAMVQIDFRVASPVWNCRKGSARR
jgi:hypothetical protein